MKKLIPIILAIGLMFSFSGCSNDKFNTQSTSDNVSLSDFFLNTVTKITIYDMEEEEAKEFITESFNYGKYLESLLSKTIETSDVMAINNSNGNWTEVADDTAYLINIAIEYSQLSDGAFDCTVAPLSELWDFNSETPSVPSEDDIASSLSHVGWENIEITGNSVRLTDPESAIDLGGIAKGYIGDKIKEFLVEKGVTKAIIDLGGNILTINPDENDSFKIGIQKPFDYENPIWGVLTINNLSVVTSGVYERYFEENGKLYHHILNSKTGYPVENQLYSVTIITENSALADVLSTTCFALGLEEGLALAENTTDVEAIFITNNYETFYTSGVGTTIKFEKN